MRERERERVREREKTKERERESEREREKKRVQDRYTFLYVGLRFYLFIFSEKENYHGRTPKQEMKKFLKEREKHLFQDEPEAPHSDIILATIALYEKEV